MDLKLKASSCIIVTGSSGSGKTILIEKLLQNHNECFERPIEELHWVYSKNAKDEKLIDRLKKLGMPVQFHDQFPEKELTSNSLFSKPREAHKCLVLDDVFISPKPCDALYEIFNIISHHNNMTCILVVQNLSGSSVSQKGCLSTLLRSTTYLVMFVNRRMLPIVRYIANNYYPYERHKIIDPFNHLLQAHSPYKYLVIDFNTLDDLLQVREGGLTPEDDCFGFRFLKK